MRGHFRHLVGESKYIALIGLQSDERKLEKVLLEYNIKAKIFRYQSASIFEHKAMILNKELAKQFPPRNTLYFHSKGASTLFEVNRGWRTYMNYHFVSNYRYLNKILHRSSKDAVGVLYTFNSKVKYKDSNNLVNYFAGNFWLDSNRYLCTLPDYEKMRRLYLNNQFLAEKHIGRKYPKVLFVDQDKVIERILISEKIRNMLCSISKIREETFLNKNS